MSANQSHRCNQEEYLNLFNQGVIDVVGLYPTLMRRMTARLFPNRGFGGFGLISYLDFDPTYDGHHVGNEEDAFSFLKGVCSRDGCDLFRLEERVVIDWSKFKVQYPDRFCQGKPLFVITDGNHELIQSEDNPDLYRWV